MAETDGARLSSIDVLKGIAIIGIVLVHTVIRRGEGVGSETPLFLQALYLLLMVFFIISGYFYRPGKGFRYNMSKRVKQLAIAILICAIVLPAITMVWLAIFGQLPADPLNDYLLAFLRAVGCYDNFVPSTEPMYCAISGSCIGYYYLLAMLVAFIIFYALADRVMDSFWNVLAVVIALLVITCLMVEFDCVRLPFYIHLGPLAAAFMFFGASLARFDFVGKVESFEWRSLRYWLPLIVCTAVFVPLLIFFHPGTQFDQFIFGGLGGPSVYVYFVQASLMFCIVIYVTKLISFIPAVGGLFRIYGEHTLGILLLHGFVIKMAVIPFFTMSTDKWFPGGLTMVQSVALSLFVLVTTLMICILGPKIIGRAMSKYGKGPASE